MNRFASRSLVSIICLAILSCQNADVDRIETQSQDFNDSTIIQESSDENFVKPADEISLSSQSPDSPTEDTTLPAEKEPIQLPESVKLSELSELDLTCGEEVIAEGVSFLAICPIPIKDYETKNADMGSVAIKNTKGTPARMSFVGTFILDEDSDEETYKIYSGSDINSQVTLTPGQTILFQRDFYLDEYGNGFQGTVISFSEDRIEDIKGERVVFSFNCTERFSETILDVDTYATCREGDQLFKAFNNAKKVRNGSDWIKPERAYIFSPNYSQIDIKHYDSNLNDGNHNKVVIPFLLPINAEVEIIIPE